MTNHFALAGGVVLSLSLIFGGGGYLSVSTKNAIFESLDARVKEINDTMPKGILIKINHQDGFFSSEGTTEIIDAELPQANLFQMKYRIEHGPLTWISKKTKMKYEASMPFFAQRFETNGEPLIFGTTELNSQSKTEPLRFSFETSAFTLLSEQRQPLLKVSPFKVSFSKQASAYSLELTGSSISTPTDKTVSLDGVTSKIGLEMKPESLPQYSLYLRVANGKGKGFSFRELVLDSKSLSDNAKLSFLSSFDAADLVIRDNLLSAVHFSSNIKGVDENEMKAYLAFFKTKNFSDKTIEMLKRESWEKIRNLLAKGGEVSFDKISFKTAANGDFLSQAKLGLIPSKGPELFSFSKNIYGSFRTRMTPNILPLLPEYATVSPTGIPLFSQGGTSGNLVSIVDFKEGRVLFGNQPLSFEESLETLRFLIMTDRAIGYQSLPLPEEMRQEQATLPTN